MLYPDKNEFHYKPVTVAGTHLPPKPPLFAFEEIGFDASQLRGLHAILERWLLG